MSRTHANHHEASRLVPAEHRKATATVPLLNVMAVSTRADRQTASGHWLLSAAPVAPEASREWAESGATWLRPGALFSAVTVRAGIVHAAVGMATPEECAGPLAEVLEGGPLFFHPAGFGTEGAYTALLPASVRRVWRLPASGVHPDRELLLVPAPDRCRPAGDGPWWVVPLDGPGLLCSPRLLAGVVERRDPGGRLLRRCS